MSFRKEHILSLKPDTGSNYLQGETEEALTDLFAEILKTGVHGFCFSLYEDGQKPGDVISETQVRRRMEILQPYTKWIRSFSCTEGNEFIPKIAKEMGLKTLVGAWLGKDDEINQREIAGLIELAKNGYVDIAAVGNEVMYRKDLGEEELVGFISKVKNEIHGIPVGYVDAYYEFSHRPQITAVCDVILCNCYPFWEACPFENALDYMKQMYYQAKAAGNGKEVIITETGWPSQGENLRGAYPSAKSARDYFINTQLWSANDNIPVFYFSSFDESWKVGAEGTVGAYWGIWDKNEQLKF
ncbi:glycosyl hydrolase [Panacibacter sp. DH6]|uniref:Endo-1,3-beta-glucanase btgC n=1 Tax=Panacibacter microcysteis TaxID=2793269 RepID=A0A931E5D0_9BACT|nr:glycosyl hydrolase family 17 protein [Panacibacter microcysteis]MBG9375575.1 glycosyl hydrolase [Panacibacter microcysteis]